MALKIQVKERNINLPDEFISTTTKVINFFYNNIKLLIYILSISIVLIAGIVVFNSYNTKKDINAFIEFTKGIDKLHSLMDKKANTKEKGSPKEFLEVIQNYPNTTAAMFSMLYLGHNYYNNGNYEKAIETYKELTSHTKDLLLSELAIKGITYSYEAIGDYDKAISSLKEILSRGSVISNAEIYLSLARYYEAKGDINGSLDSYKKIATEFPTFEKIDEVKEKIGELERHTS